MSNKTFSWQFEIHYTRMENKLPKPIVNQSNIKESNKKKNKLKVQTINNPRKKKKHCCCLKWSVSTVKAIMFFICFQYFNRCTRKLVRTHILILKKTWKSKTIFILLSLLPLQSNHIFKTSRLIYSYLFVIYLTFYWSPWKLLFVGLFLWITCTWLGERTFLHANCL